MTDKEINTAIQEKILKYSSENDSLWLPATSLDDAFEAVDLLDMRTPGGWRGGGMDFKLEFHYYEQVWISTFNWSENKPVSVKNKSRTKSVCFACLAVIAAVEEDAKSSLINKDIK